MPLVLSTKWVDRNHKVDTEQWGDAVRHYPMHYVFLLGWQYYPSRNSDDGRVHFLFQKTAVQHLLDRIAHGQ